MDEQKAQDLLNQRGYGITDIRMFPFGANRDVFEATREDGTPIIARFVKEGKHRDAQYNGLISLERDANMYALAGKAGLPTPSVLGYHDVEGIPFLVVEKLPGKHWKTFVEGNNYSLEAYLRSLEFLGQDVAKAHAVVLPSYGDMLSANCLQPAGIKNFAERLDHIFALKLAKAETVLPTGEFARVKQYFAEGVRAVSAQLEEGNGYKPVLVLTNLHPMNFLVDEQGKPSGYPDLEFSQAGVPALEMYNMGLQLFSYFDKPTFNLAEEAFFKGYTLAGGVYDRENSTNKQLEALLCGGHALSSVTFYQGAKDGLRDNWSAEFKDILFKVMGTGEMDYVAFADVIRQKTQQPNQPTRP